MASVSSVVAQGIAARDVAVCEFEELFMVSLSFEGLSERNPMPP